MPTHGRKEDSSPLVRKQTERMNNQTKARSLVDVRMDSFFKSTDAFVPFFAKLHQNCTEMAKKVHVVEEGSVLYAMPVLVCHISVSEWSRDRSKFASVLW